MDAALHFCVLSGAEDQPFVAALAEGLRAGEWGVWSAADLRAGDDRAAEMQAALGRATCSAGAAGTGAATDTSSATGSGASAGALPNTSAPFGGRPIGSGVRDEHIID